MMSVLNLGLQAIGLARNQLPEDLEEVVEKCNNLGHLRELARKTASTKEAVLVALSPAKITLTNIHVAQ